jgi:hypothetical protein
VHCKFMSMTTLNVDCQPERIGSLVGARVLCSGSVLSRNLSEA